MTKKKPPYLTWRKPPKVYYYDKNWNLVKSAKGAIAAWKRPLTAAELKWLRKQGHGRTYEELS